MRWTQTMQSTLTGGITSKRTREHNTTARYQKKSQRDGPPQGGGHGWGETRLLLSMALGGWGISKGGGVPA